MNGFGSFFRQLGYRMSNGLRNFMSGRYGAVGTDKLNMAILGAGVIMALISVFFRGGFINPILTLLSYVCMFWAIFRLLSRNTYKRYQENRRYLMLLDRLKDREHKYFSCPRCRQSVRVPKGKGKIAITCPKCRERFVRKS